MASTATDVRYVCLSDLHLGAADSVLTPLTPMGYDVDRDVAGPVLEQLVSCLEQLILGNAGARRPTLILNGDVLELATSTFDQALANFERLAALLLDRELFERFVYIPGNHDHHIWEIARETQYAHAIVGRRAPQPMPPLRHVSSLRLDGAVPAYLLNKLFEHVHPAPGPAHPEAGVSVVYPNLALLDDAGRRCVIVHHGHYVESIYHFFSKARRWLFPDRPEPSTVDEIEEENFAWIDFVWSLLGRSGGAGVDMLSLFRMLQSPEEFRVFADALARRTAVTTRVLPWRALRRLVYKRAFMWLGPKIVGERSQRQVALSPALADGVSRYLFGPTYRQVEGQLGAVPDDLTFVFGHTHKPFETVLTDPAGRAVAVYNTGGWPIDSREPFETMGASIVFLNERLDVASLRVYNDGPGGGTAALDVRAAGTGDGGDAFRNVIAERVRPGGAAPAAPWGELARLIGSAIRRRQRAHRETYDAIA
jgi:hypothetical protein